VTTVSECVLHFNDDSTTTLCCNAYSSQHAIVFSRPLQPEYQPASLFRHVLQDCLRVKYPLTLFAVDNVIRRIIAATIEHRGTDDNIRGPY
jgi:hypothetical protein